MGVLNAALFKTYALFGRTKGMNPVVLQLARLYATDDKQVKQEKKLAKKLAAIAAEPQFYQDRSNKWTELKQKYAQAVVAKGQEIINVTLLDGKKVEGFSWEITPLDVAKSISHALAAEVYIAKVNDKQWDLERPLETDCNIQLEKLDSLDAKKAFWTTAACTLAEALERLYCTDNGGVVCNVGSTQTGFFADIKLNNKTINRKDIAAIEEGICKIFSGQRVKVERIEAFKNEANELFANNPFISKTINDTTEERVPIYRCGSFIHISDTPLIRHNKKVHTIKVLEIESITLNGEPIQRLRGIAFTSTNELKKFLQSR